MVFSNYCDIHLDRRRLSKARPGWHNLHLLDTRLIDGRISPACVLTGAEGARDNRARKCISFFKFWWRYDGIPPTRAMVSAEFAILSPSAVEEPKLHDSSIPFTMSSFTQEK